MRKWMFLLLFIIGIYPVKAQDTIRSLIISEWRGDHSSMAYLELANTGNTAVDLSRFTIAQYPWTAWLLHYPETVLRLDGQLQPGATYLLANYSYNPEVPDRNTPVHMHPLADKLVYLPTNAGVVSPFYSVISLWNGTYASAIYYHLDNGDSVMVDAVRNWINLDGKNLLYNTPGSVAGIESAPFTHVLVRKASVTRGNTNWDNARGVSLEDSEWLPIPHTGYNYAGPIFTTVKSHGDYNFNITSETIGINMTDTVLTVPWGIYKGDSIIWEFKFGPNHGWKYTEIPNASDSAFAMTRTGDVLTIYVAGNQLRQMDFKVVLAEPANNYARIMPMRVKNFQTGAWTKTNRFYVTEDQSIIDTIGNVPFATRVDTLFSYLLKAPKASWEIVWVDGITRVDLKHGDILKVKAEDGVTVKEYFIDVQDYEPSSIASLSAITWPDKPDMYMEGWRNDTIPSFHPGLTSYKVRLPYGTSQVPALIPIPLNPRAKIESNRAVSLRGNIGERTTTLTVTAEDDSTILTYTVLFEVEKMEEQEFRGEPFISQIVHKYWHHNGFVEIVNPGNVPLSLDEYMILMTNEPGNPADLLQGRLSNTEADWANRYHKYVPGYRFQSLQDWQVKPGLLTIDPAIDPVLDPGEVFIAGRYHHLVPERRPPQEIMDQVDIHFSRNVPNIWDEMGYPSAIGWSNLCNASWYLFKIENDSVLNGTKPIGDPKDYRLVDMFGSFAGENWNLDGFEYTNQWVTLKRKPSVWKGNPENKGSWGTEATGSEWTMKVKLASTAWGDQIEGLGFHAMDEVTAHLSTVSSIRYRISDGFQGLQTIRGNITGKTIEDFYEFINKADTAQVLTIKSGTDGTVKNAGSILAGGDTLMVVSADTRNTTKYLLTHQALDNNALLTAKPGSGYVIETTGNTGTITGISYTATLKEVLENVIKSGTAELNVIDTQDHLVPLTLQIVNTAEYIADSLVLTYGKVDARILNSFFFEVVAEDGITIITYKLVPTALSSDAFVISNLFDVNEESRIISKIPYGVSVAAFNENVEASGNASMKITDKMGLVREIGVIRYDDRLVVTSEDLSKTVIYYLDFIDERNVDRSADARLNNLRVNGNSIEGFDPSTYSYTLVINLSSGTPPVPVVEAEASDPEAVVTVTQAENMEGSEVQRTATIKVLAQDGVTEITYTVLFNVVVGVPGQSGNDIQIYAEGKTICIKTDFISKDDEVEVYNVMGQKIMQRKITTTFERLEVNYPGNLFIVKVKWAGRMEVEKLILK